ncbi:IS66 family transposase [Variovorax boronicumulans]|uniref:IS66 family transposase n=1 Tax=Variovorax boronicumulans TaxID=436515 RepID=UPI0012E66E57|nr:IS66 family transposase [Variovorax boronicumulans]GER19505.1 IS66 family transposase [Variovorax boronicumulans]
MQALHDLKDEDLQGLAPEAIAALAQQMLRHLRQQDSEIRFKDAKIEKITFQLARLKAWKFGARTEAMSAEQRRLFDETLAEDEASLQAQLEQARGEPATPAKDDTPTDRKPRRKPLPDDLRREDHYHEPDNTNCPSPGCGKPMVRVGQDISERLDIVPAEFFVHRHIYGKWACRCCECLVQEAVAPQIIDGGMPAAGLIAHTIVSHFVDHLPYYRMESINARSNVHTPRSTLASWSGQGGAALMPLYDAHKRFVLSAQVLHADETPVAMLDPGRGQTKRAYVWTYARGAFDAVPGVIYDFCVGRGAQYPVAFLGPEDDGHGATAWRGTLVRDEYAAYDKVMVAQPGRIPAGCLAHARRKFDELLRDGGKSAVADEALRRIAQIYRIERELAALTTEERLASRQRDAKPLWEELHAWLRLERSRVPDGSSTARALSYSLNAWAALTQNLLDGDVNVDNNHCENQIRPWAVGRKAWLFAGSELAGQRAAVVMSLVQSAKLNGHDPWAYLKDVLTRLPTHLNSRIDELLPHRWSPLQPRQNAGA